MKANTVTKTETHFALEYTKLNGERATKTYPTMERLEAALTRCKAEYGDVLAEKITPVQVPVPESPLDRALRADPFFQVPISGYAVESYDPDSQSWDLVDDISPCSSRHEAEEEARNWKRSLCGSVRTRIVKL